MIHRDARERKRKSVLLRPSTSSVKYPTNRLSIDKWHWLDALAVEMLWLSIEMRVASRAFIVFAKQ